MYEEITYDIILQRMLDRVMKQDPNLDTREGSIIYDALAPAAIEIQNLYIQLDTIMDETFADTASRESLIKRAAERGISPSDATKAVIKAEFNIDIPIGSRFSLGDLTYIVIGHLSTGVLRLECESPGRAGNQGFGTLIPINYIDGLEKAQVTQVLIPGEEEEETEQLRGRYFGSLNASSFGGNVADYKEKVNAINGVGGVKVYPAWNGGGTVGLVIIDSTFGVPSSALIDTIQTAIDPVQNQGQGVGIAPIGHVVTVSGVASAPVNITTNITYQDGWRWEDIKPHADKAIDDYLQDLAATWADDFNLIVRISQVETRLLNITGVIDIAGTTINEIAQNLVLHTDDIPVRGILLGQKPDPLPA